MTKRTVVIGAALALALGASLVGCASGPIADRDVPETGITSAESTAAMDATAAVLPDGSGSTTPAEIKAVDQQLDAMQREIDSLSMPTDSDFGSAEGALY